jgi:hypothetical protein
MLYMTLMMVAPMVVLMVLAMGHMFPSKKANAALILGQLRYSPDHLPSSARKQRSAIQHSSDR